VLRALRDYLEVKVEKIVPSVIFTSGQAIRADYNSHMIFPGTQSDALLFLLDQEGICVSAGSACQAGVLGPSHVLTGMGYSPELASACIRVTLGVTSTKADIEKFLVALAKIYPIALQATPA
jgi:cysteine desulfurase